MSPRRLQGPQKASIDPRRPQWTPESPKAPEGPMGLKMPQESQKDPRAPERFKTNEDLMPLVAPKTPEARKAPEYS
jgi:hypothetical protein